MKIISMAFIIVMLSSISYALDMEVNEINNKLRNVDTAKQCDYYKFVSILKENSYTIKATLTDKNNNKIKIEGEILNFRGCINLDGDGVPEAVINDYHRAAGGAPINETRIYKSKNNKFEQIGHFVGEFGESTAFIDLNKDGKTEVITYATWSNWGDLDLRDSPATPIVNCYQDSKFIDCTKKFPQIIRTEIDDTLKETRDRKKHEEEYKKDPVLKEQYLEFRKGRALKYLALFSELGQEKKGWEGVRKHFPECYEWLKSEWSK